MQVIQKILFGCSGTGKSHRVSNNLLKELKIVDEDTENCIKTIFHPEYTYGDFMGKLLPITKGGKVEYLYYEGHFLKALAQAYKNILNADHVDKIQNVALVVDELNRGNSAAIFGTIFQLLDREIDGDKKGWSSYEISISEMEFEKLLNLIGIHTDPNYNSDGSLKSKEYKIRNQKYTEDSLAEYLKPIKIKNKKIKLPPNLSIIATMNISDNSIYFMDSAFKRRWEWEFINTKIKKSEISDEQLVQKTILEFNYNWIDFIDKLNLYIKAGYKSIRRIEDKQIGYWFIKEKEITVDCLKNKLMFFVWDSVFSHDKSPLINLLGLVGKEHELVTFGDFTDRTTEFIEKIWNFKN